MLTASDNVNVILYFILVYFRLRVIPVLVNAGNYSQTVKCIEIFSKSKKMNLDIFQHRTLALSFKTNDLFEMNYFFHK